VTSRGRESGFTLVEILVVIAIIGILAALLLTAISKGKQRAQGTYCVNNGRQMMIAMTLYSSDFKELFPPNPDDGNTIPGHNWCCGSAGRGESEEFNPDILKDPTRSLLAPYLKGDISVFHCPGDTRTGLYQGADPALAGKTVAAVRTFSMNQAVGTICQGYDKKATDGMGSGGWSHAGAPTLPVNGPWLNNMDNNLRDAPWITFGKMSEIPGPGPSMLWVLVDEDVNNLNDAAFAFGMEHPLWIDAPGTYHDGGCGFAFADGHSESHHWQSTKGKMGHRAPVTSAGDFQDWMWMRSRTSANISGTMPAPR
jgi:prepilin-type N-terminal cleavage/methylation domain-containing protein/prepilin-type processing-associated H-X9-DG protein